MCPKLKKKILNVYFCFYEQKELVRHIVRNNGILVTSYNTLVIHQESILAYNWHYVVLDEGHKIRNPDVQATLVAKQVGLFATPALPWC